MAACVVLGSRVLASADDTVAVWAVSHDVGIGEVVQEDDLTAHDVRFVDPADADRYLSASAPLPDAATLDRPVAAGELLPRAALGVAADTAQRTVTVLFTGPGVPAGLATGDLVEVYVTSVEKQQSGQTDARARLVLGDVLVTDLATAADSLAGSGARAVTVAIPADVDPDHLAVMVQAAKTDNLYLVKRG